MKKYNVYQKMVALLLSAIIVLEFSGCYSMKGVSKSEIQHYNKFYYYIHGPASYFQINNVLIADGVLTGTIYETIKPMQKSQSVHIYVAPDSSIKIKAKTVNIPVINIAKAEIYKVDGGKTVLLGLGLAGGALFVVLLVALLLKGASCPFIYSDDGLASNFEGEIYSGATALPLERSDYLQLKAIKPVDNQYKIKLTNEVNEIQNTNLTELLVYDHSPGTAICVDKYGNAHTIEALSKPVYAYDNYGRSVINELSYLDSIRYISDVKSDLILNDTISLSFNKPSDVTSSKLIISGKNTMWLDYMFGRFADLFGKRYDKWKETRDKKSREELQQWTLDQGMPLTVYMETDSGWKFVDYFNIPGPMADKEDILQLDISDVSGDKINLKLVAGLLFWDIDFVGMDFTVDQSIKKTIAPVSTAIDENQKNVSALLLNDDDKYLIQPDGNNVTSITFNVPETIPDMDRSVILHSIGNYEILRVAKGKPDIVYLKSFLEPGAFIKFSKDHFLKYYHLSN